MAPSPLEGEGWGGLMKTAVFWSASGLTSGRASVALVSVEAWLPPYGEFAWTRPHGRASKPTSQHIRLPSRFKLGSSDAVATVGRRSTRNSRSNRSDSSSASRTSARVELAGEAKQWRLARRRKNFGSATPNSRLNSTHLQTRLKKKVPDLPALTENPSFADVPAAHGYPCGVIALFLGLVQLGISLRAVSRVLEFVASFFGLPFSAPDWTTGRMWLLRFGLAQLNAPKDQATDWVWLIDHSVQIGKVKVLAILGIRLIDLPMPDRCLCPQDMVLIDLVPMETSSRTDVAKRLEDAAVRTSVPRAIIDDHGVDLNGGVQIFQQSHPDTVEIYDAKHKAACLLKSRLEKNPRWMAFSTRVGQTRCAIQQTELGALTPPGPKPKARYMNLENQLDWADKVLALLDGLPGSAPSWATPQRLEEKLGWLREFRDDLAEWRRWQAIVDRTVSFVGSEGLHAKTARTLSRQLRPLAKTAQGCRLAAELVKFVKAQASKAKPEERLPGSTEVLESCFGRFKTLERDQAKGGFTSLLLGFGSMFVDATIETVGEAMHAVPTRAVIDWCREHIGPTLFSQRKEAFAIAGTAQQKLAEVRS